MMGGEKKTAPNARGIQTKVRDLRSATFHTTRKGFDPDEVRTYLHRLASWLEGVGLADPEEVRRELALVGKRTSEILTKADETANALRADAQRNAGELLDTARAEADRIRAEAEEYAGRVRLDAGAKAEEIVEEADRRAEHMIDAAVKRRQHLEVLIDDLVSGRNEILADTRRLVEEMRALVDQSAGVGAEEPEVPEEGEQPAAGVAAGDTVAFSAVDDEEEAGGEMDGEPDFSVRDGAEEQEEQGEPEPLEADTEEHSPERASPGAS
jgi:DivIVA domain-containing protein